MKPTLLLSTLLLFALGAMSVRAQTSGPGVRLPENQPRSDLGTRGFADPDERVDGLDDFFLPIDADAPVADLDDEPQQRLSPEEMARRDRIRAERQAASTNNTRVEAPLYQRHPPHQVVVGEVGTDYVLTRLELDRMLESEGARFVHSADGFTEEDAAGHAAWSEKAEATGIKMQHRREADLLNEWAVMKTMVVLARRDGITASAEEVETALAEMSRKATSTTGRDAGGGGVAGIPALLPGISEAQLRREITEGLLVDKFIIERLKRRFTEDDLQNLFLRNPAHFSDPPRVRAWQIVRRLDRNITKEEERDIRRDLHNLVRKLRRRDGKNFPEIAAVESDASNAAMTRGDLGWIELPFFTESERRGNVVNIAPITFDEEIMQALQRLEPGRVSDIIRTRSALHILHVSEKDPGSELQYTPAARERVIASLIESWKKDYGLSTMYEAASIFPVRLNPSGLRLVSEPSAPFEPSQPPAETRPVIPVGP